MTPLIIERHQRAPGVLPVNPLTWRERGGRPLFVHWRTIHLETMHGWIRIPRGYVTDFGSIPGVATWLSFSRLRPFDTHAMAADGHDWPYAIGESGKRPMWDDAFLDRMKTDGVNPARRSIMHRAVRVGGDGGYKRAPSWWDTENFADPETGEPIPPPFRREEAFIGARWGLRPRPDWD